MSGIAQLILSSLLLFFVIPIFLKVLGTELYGVFSLITVIGNLNLFANLGLNSALVKYLSEQGKTIDSDHDIWVNIAILIGISILLLTVGILMHEVILLKILNIKIDFFPEARILYFFVLAGNAIVFVGQPFTAMLDAQHKIHLTNLSQFVYSIMYWGLILCLLLLDLRFEYMGAAIFIASSAWLFISIGFAFRSWGIPQLGGIRKVFRKSAYKQLVLGSQIYSAGLIGLLYEPLTRVLLSHYIGIREVGYYDIALRIRSQIWGIVSRAFYPLYPLIAQLQDPVKLRFLVHDIEQKTFMLMVPATALTVLLLPPFVRLWLGEETSAITITAVFLVGAYLIGSVTVLPNYQFLMLKGKASKTVVLQASNVTFNLLTFYLCVEVYGYYAVVFGGVVAILSSFALSLYYQHRYLDSLVFDDVQMPLKLAFVFFVELLAGYAISILVTSDLGKIGLILPLMLLLTVLMYRSFRLVKATDVTRYLGSWGNLANLTFRLLCRS